MKQKQGGASPYKRSHQAAVDAARQRVLSTYNSTMEKLGEDTTKKPKLTRKKRAEKRAERRTAKRAEKYANGRADKYADKRAEKPEIEIPAEALPKAPATARTLKDSSPSEDAAKEGWQEYHSAWQNYYQKYYNEYYSQAAQNYLETEKLKDARIAGGEKRRQRRAKVMVPVILVALVILVLVFLEYNRLIFAPIMAYISPDVNSVSTTLEAIDPNVTQAVSAEPRLIIPKLNIDVPVAFGIHYSEVMSAMNYGVAQFKIAGANAMPGQVGNLVISGHSAGDIYSSNPYKFIFSGLERLEPGDLIYINYESVRYTYKMTHNEVVEPTDVDALIYETERPVLTLITCTPLGTSRYRLLVTAEQISPVTWDESDVGEWNDEGAENDVAMPGNTPSFFEQVWQSLFGG